MKKRGRPYKKKYLVIDCVGFYHTVYESPKAIQFDEFHSIAAVFDDYESAEKWRVAHETYCTFGPEIFHIKTLLESQIDKHVKEQPIIRSRRFSKALRHLHSLASELETITSEEFGFAADAPEL
ncbi:MAG: hypothetical protein JAY75_22595 [Candidatus Thiodiazotropha taylori]|nr:hypothetical protein [Candidatus Thiodiazotropha taylori]MCG8095354.1 hypothetical protein [Candidatus Thiodiazotropha endolucinida]MCG8058397.1 hypothetical protein [Candidatus Thiodiazotropha taylori]MCG8079011.1 hypothetical protein [Candidatus Thiodiazotropha taylori]MCG8102742.1 hypothetical protein [Candidatus Thiodiazotropha taylori]